MFIFAEKKTVERLSIDIIGGTSKILVDIDHSWSKSWSMYRVAQK